MKIYLMGVKLFHADGYTGRHDNANRHFSQFVNVLKNGCL